MTYSVYNIKVDNQLSFTPGATAGYVLGINSDGSTSWIEGGGGSQTLEQVLANGNNVGTYSIVAGNGYPYIAFATASGEINLGAYVSISDGASILSGTLQILGITSSLLATDSTGKIIATSSVSGTSGTSGISGTAGTSGTSGISLLWGGTFSSPPGSPSINTAYYNTTDKKSYVWAVTQYSTPNPTWTVIAQDGLDGTSGTSGVNGTSGTTPAGSTTGSIGIVLDGAGTTITTGVKSSIQIPYSGTITGWTILADQVGSIVVDVWKDDYATYPPSSLDSIAGTEKPTLSSSIKNEDNSLSTWTTSVNAGDIITFNVDSASTLTRVNLAIKITKS